MSVFLISSASSTVLPFTHSVASEEEAMAEPQPKVLNLASSITRVSGFTLIWSPDQSRANCGAVLIHLTDVARIVVVLNYLIAVCHTSSKYCELKNCAPLLVCLPLNLR